MQAIRKTIWAMAVVSLGLTLCADVAFSQIFVLSMGGMGK